MPARNGTGPEGQGSRTGRGKGNCKSSKASTDQSSTSASNQPVLGGGRGWGTWINNIFRRGRVNRIHRK